MNENILEINDLAVSFSVGGERLHALRGVSLSLRHGETLALVGESGSGKSVTSRAVLGILPKNARVDGGSIKFCGKEIIGATEKELCALRGRQMAMIFQDPTSALDPELTGEVLRVIRGLKSEDSTMIVVTHEMEFARNVADTVIYMADGVIEEMGTPEELLEKKGKYYKLIKIQSLNSRSDEITLD